MLNTWKYSVSKMLKKRANKFIKIKRKKKVSYIKNNNNKHQPKC
jgi:hypothetical protein